MHADLVQVWLIDTELPAAVVAELAGLLDQPEWARAGTFGDPRARRRFVVSHAAVRQIVGSWLAAPPRELRWRRGEHGKPALTGTWTGPAVNLSHSGGFALVAISGRRPVGVDIQEISVCSDPIRLAGRFFPAGEARMVAAATDPAQRQDRLARLWLRRAAPAEASDGREATEDERYLRAESPPERAGVT